MYDEMLAAAGVDDWTGDDCSVTHEECGTRIEPDAHRCPECGETNPLIAMGMI
jgi:hypothetical protein